METLIKKFEKTSLESSDSIGFCFEKKGSELVEYPYKLPELLDNEIKLEILYTSLCNGDSLFPNMYGYPFIIGHETVGILKEKGSKVKGFNIGDRVGYGIFKSECKKCENCFKGFNQHCEKGLENYIFKLTGSLTTIMHLPFEMAFHCPESIPTKFIPPLFCAGITVYAPMKKFFNKDFTLGVAGIGGLGHLALQFAKPMGYKNVYAFSSNSDKEKECIEYGSDKFIDISKDGIEKYKFSCDIILLTTSKLREGDFQNYINVLAPNGKLVILSGIDNSKNVHGFVSNQFVGFEKSIVGSKSGTKSEMNEMLRFVAKHKTYPKIEEFAWKDSKTAWEKLMKGEIRYRAVINVEDFQKTLKI